MKPWITKRDGRWYIWGLPWELLVIYAGTVAALLYVYIVY